MGSLFRILVLVKMVPEVAQMRFNTDTMTVVREGVKNVVNPFDRRAVEAAVLLRDRFGGDVTTVSMGPPWAEETLRFTLAAGADRSVLLTDPTLSGADTLATSTALSLAARKLGFDLVLGGVSSVDAETSQVIPETAQLLGVRLVTNARSIEIEGSKLTVERDFEEGTETFELDLPAVVSVNEKINHPRGPTEEDKVRALQKPLEVWPASALSDDVSLFGTAGSPTSVKSLFDTSFQRAPKVFDGRTDLAPAVAGCLAELSRLVSGAPPEATDMSRATESKTAWVVILSGANERRTSLEVLGKARSLGLRPVAVLLPDFAEDGATSELAEAGAEEVLKLKSPTASSSSLFRSEALSRAIGAEQPFALFLPSTVNGREVAGRLAASLRIGLTGDASDLSFHRRGDLIMVKPAFGGSVMAEIVSKSTPRMATVRPGVFPILSFRPAAAPTREFECGPIYDEGSRVIFRAITVDPKAGDLDRAEAIVCGGFGLGSKEAFDSLATYALRIGAALGATRKAVDAGWAPPQSQVGLTGKSVHPSLIVEVGVSGSVNHTIGIRRARTVFAINRDPEALSLKSCDVGLVAEAAPALEKLEDGLRSIVASLEKVV